jgi:glycosyltransferase involved in cell wall biosynthesis
MGTFRYSIIIPTLNEEKLIGKLLKQISDKSLKDIYNYEVIVSDGGSTDNTVELAINYCDIVKVHCEKYKQNIAKGRNVGAEFSNGEILIFLNADTVLSNPVKFFDFLNNHFYNSNYLAMTCFVRIFPSEETTPDKIFHFMYNRYFQMLNFLGVGMGRGECQIIRKDVFKQFDGYNEALAAGEDFDLFKRIRRKGKILYSNDIFIFESPRRFRKLGYKNVTSVWIKNGLSVFFKNKAISEEWEQIR